MSGKERITTLDDKGDGKQKTEIVADEPKVINQGGAVLSGKKVRIILPQGATPDEKEAQFVAVNGFEVLIPRGKEVVVPVEIYEVLKNANRGEFNGAGEASGVVNRFNAQYLGEVLPKAA
jgi:hypothetical protein